MAYDEGLAERIREHMEGIEGLTEKKMMGGLAFMIHGHIAAAAKGETLVIRCAKEDWDAFCAEPSAGPMMRGKTGMTSWVVVDIDAVAEDEELAKWVERGRDFARSQDPK
jgi:TfoX/Sxy family transcriptional regulator of competence genes